MQGGSAREALIFALDFDSELGKEATRGLTRFELCRRLVTMVIQAKQKMHMDHEFGLLACRTEPRWISTGVSNDTSVLLDQLQHAQPDQASYTAFDLGSLAGLLKHVHANRKADTAKIRVVLLYGRSSVIPEWRTHASSSLALDVVYLHDRPLEGVNCPQQVFSALEDQADRMSAKVQHTAYIWEITSFPSKKLQSICAGLVAHPLRRKPQAQQPAPVELSSLPYCVGDLRGSSIQAAAAAMQAAASQQQQQQQQQQPQQQQLTSQTPLWSTVASSAAQPTAAGQAWGGISAQQLQQQQQQQSQQAAPYGGSYDSSTAAATAAATAAVAAALAAHQGSQQSSAGAPSYPAAASAVHQGSQQRGADASSYPAAATPTYQQPQRVSYAAAATARVSGGGDAGSLGGGQQRLSRYPSGEQQAGREYHSRQQQAAQQHGGEYPALQQGGGDYQGRQQGVQQGVQQGRQQGGQPSGQVMVDVVVPDHDPPPYRFKLARQ